MKKIFILLLSLAIGSYCFGQNKKYIGVMEKTIKNLDTCKSAGGFQQVANAFERIGNAEKKEWLPSYYVALCNVYLAGMSSGDKVDEYCDIAEKNVSCADSLNPNNSEVYALRSLIYSQRIAVNPMLRGAKFGGKSNEMSAKAKELDPTNPRPYLLQGQGKYYTPAQFGGGKEKALPILEEAVAKYGSFKPVSTIHPDWGRQRALNLLEDCKKSK
jgi:hypothetical protein